MAGIDDNNRDGDGCIDKYDSSPLGSREPVRFHLPPERNSRVVKMRLVCQADVVSGVKIVEGYFIVGMYDDGYPGELFIYVDKEGSEIHGWAQCWSTSISMMLQYGIPPEKIYNKFRDWYFDPAGFTNLKDVPICKSIIDLIMRYMKHNFIPTAENAKNDGYAEMIEAVISDESNNSDRV